MPYDFGMDIGSGFSGVPAVGTGYGGTGASEAVGEVSGQSESQTVAAQVPLIPGCRFCSNPTVQQAAFIIAVGLLVFGWHLHIRSIME